MVLDTLTQTDTHVSHPLDMCVEEAVVQSDISDYQLEHSGVRYHAATYLYMLYIVPCISKCDNSQSVGDIARSCKVRSLNRILKILNMNSPHNLVCLRRWLVNQICWWIRSSWRVEYLHFGNEHDHCVGLPAN